MVIFDGEDTVIYNGGKLNSFVRFRNKELAKLQNKISRCKKHKPQNRNYNCQCGFKYHRDGVGAINIFRKYINGSLKDKSIKLEGVLTSPYGVRYKPNSISCSIKWNTRPFGRGIPA